MQVQHPPSGKYALWSSQEHNYNEAQWCCVLYVFSILPTVSCS